MLISEHKQKTDDISRTLLAHVHAIAKTFQGILVTQDDSWIYDFIPKPKIQSKQRKCSGCPFPKKFKPVDPVDKSMTSVIFILKICYNTFKNVFNHL